MTSPKFLDRVRAVIRAKHYSYRTEQTYIRWITRYIYYHEKRHPEHLTGDIPTHTCGLPDKRRLFVRG